VLVSFATCMVPLIEKRAGKAFELTVTDRKRRTFVLEQVRRYSGNTNPTRPMGSNCSLGAQ